MVPIAAKRVVHTSSPATAKVLPSASHLTVIIFLLPTVQEPPLLLHQEVSQGSSLFFNCHPIPPCPVLTSSHHEHLPAFIRTSTHLAPGPWRYRGRSIPTTIVLEVGERLSSRAIVVGKAWNFDIERCSTHSFYSLVVLLPWQSASSFPSTQLNKPAVQEKVYIQSR